MFVSNIEAFKKNFKEFFLLILKWLSVTIVIKVFGVGTDNFQFASIIEVTCFVVLVAAFLSLALSFYVDYAER